MSYSFCWSPVSSVVLRRAFRQAAGGGVDQHGLADGGELAEELADAEAQAGALGLAAHQVGDLQGEHAGEGVHADVVLGPVVHRGEGDHVRVFKLAEAGLGLGLGPVTGDRLGYGPVVMVGDQHVLAEQFLFQGGAGVWVDAPGEPQVLGLLAVQLPGDDPADPRACG